MLFLPTLLLQETHSKESQALLINCILHRLPYKKWSKEIPYDPFYIPSGSVEWFLEYTGWAIKPDYYPDFLKPLLGRKVWEQDKWPIGQKVFIKPSDKHKRFTGKITDGSYKGKKKGPYWCSEIVEFTNEWRYYVADGKVLFVGWYWGLNDEAIAPAFDESIIPADFCGAIDMGTTKDGRYLLIEANEPFSIGWYGNLNQGAIYSEFIERGYEYLKRKYGVSTN